MRYVTFVNNGTATAGILNNDGIYPLKDLTKIEAHTTLLNFIASQENEALPDFASIIQKHGLAPIPLAAVKLCAPIPVPFRNIICLGKNYAEHAKEILETKLSTQGDDLIPSAPVYFSKNANPAVGDGDTVPLHNHFSQKVDYEVELAVIIGKTISRVAPEAVEDAIFGYTILNDVTARDVQTAYGQWYFGKSLDGFCPMGPNIISRDEIPFPVSLDIACRVNGEVRQHSNTAFFIFDIPRVISELSLGMTLYPGDIIATGTPGGIGHAKNPPVYLQKGDKVECEIEKIGTLTNYFA